MRQRLGLLVLGTVLVGGCTLLTGMERENVLAPGAHLWSKRFSYGTSQDVTSVAIDSAGNIVVIGDTRNTNDPTVIVGDLIVSKFSATGEYIWSRIFGDDDGQIGASVAIDSEDNIILTGDLKGEIDLGDKGVLVSEGDRDIFLIKLNASGVIEWGKRFGDEAEQRGAGVAVGSGNRIVLTGSLEGTADFGGMTLESMGGSDIFVAEFDENGNYLWSERFGGGEDQGGQSVAIDSAGNIVVAGSFLGTFEFGGKLLASTGAEDIFVVKLSADYNQLWSRSVGGTSGQFGLSVAIDSADQIVVVGHFSDTLDLKIDKLESSGSADIYAIKLDSSGNPMWGTRFGDPEIQLGVSVATDSANNVVLTGRFEGTVEFKDGFVEASKGGWDIFLVKLDPLGHYVWSRTFGDVDYQSGSSVTTDKVGNVVLTGNFGGTVDFGGGPLKKVGGDIFLAKFAP